MMLYDSSDCQRVSLICIFQRKAEFSGGMREKLTLQVDKWSVDMCLREARTVKRSFQISKLGNDTLERKPLHGQLGMLSEA